MFQAKADQRNRYLQYVAQTQSWSLPQILPFPLPQPDNFGLNVTKIKYPMGYNNCDVLETICKINVIETDAQIKALENLNNAMKNTEIQLHVIEKSNLLVCLKRMLNECFKSGDTNDRRPLLVCELLQLFAVRKLGAQKIVECRNLIEILIQCIKWMGKKVGCEASQTLELMATFPQVALKLLNMNLVAKIKPLLANDTTENEYLYNLLAILLQLAPDTGLNEIYFEFLNNKLNADNQYLQSALKCFALLVNCSRGQHLCDIFVILRKLNAFLMRSGLDLKIYEYAALALQNSTHSFQSRMAAIEYRDLPAALIKHSQTRENAHLQMYALQSLRQLTENYNIKMMIRRTNHAKIKSIECLSKEGRKIKQNLLDWLNFEVFDCYWNQ